MLTIEARELFGGLTVNRFIEVTKLEYVNKNNKVLGYIKKGYNDNEYDIYMMFVDGPYYTETLNTLEDAKEAMAYNVGYYNIK